MQDMNSNTVFLTPPLPLNRWKGKTRTQGKFKDSDPSQNEKPPPKAGGLRSSEGGQLHHCHDRRLGSVVITIRPSTAVNNLNFFCHQPTPRRGWSDWYSSVRARQFGPSHPKCRSVSHICHVTVALLPPVVPFPHGVLRQLEQIWSTKLWTAVQCFWFFLTGDRIVRNQRCRRLCPGK